MKTKIKEVTDKVATLIAQNKVVTAALVSLAVICGAVAKEDAATWAAIVTAVAQIVSVAL